MNEWNDGVNGMERINERTTKRRKLNQAKSGSDQMY